MSAPSNRQGGVDVGQLIMVGSLTLVLVVIVGLVLRFDPEARATKARDHDR